MKHKKKLKRLEGRIQDYNKTVAGAKGNDARAYTKPGSLNK